MSITCIICPTVTMSAQNRTEKKISEMMERRWSHVHTEYSEKHHWRTKIVFIQASLIDAKIFFKDFLGFPDSCFQIVGPSLCKQLKIRVIFP